MSGKRVVNVHTRARVQSMFNLPLTKLRERDFISSKQQAPNQVLKICKYSWVRMLTFSFDLSIGPYSEIILLVHVGLGGAVA